MDSSKRRKLSFNEDNCCFCQKQLNKTNKTVLDPKKSQSLFTLSKERADNVSVNIALNEDNILSGDLKLCYHKACRSKYLHPFYRKNQEESFHQNAETPGKFTRSQVKPEFDWKTKCYICGDNCSLKHRKTWSKVEGSISETSKLYSKLLKLSSEKGDDEVHSRLLSSKGDLVAVEARYHRKKNCLARYLSDRNNNVFKSLYPEKSKLEKAGEILKEEFQVKIETEKCVFELSALRTRLREICKENEISIGKRKLLATHIKKALKKCWPELKFISRHGMTDLVCTNSMTVEDATAKYFELEKSFSEINEEGDCHSDLWESLTLDPEISVLHQAAVILRKRISQTEGLQQEYYSPNELTLEAQREFLDPLLLRFVNWLFRETKLNEGVDAADSVIDKKTITICSDITSLVKNIVTPKHLGLTVYLHHSYGSKKLIEDLNSHGYTLPYSEVRHFLTSAALHMTQIQQQTPSGGIVPSHMTRNDEKTALLVAVADNWDHNENTLSGKQSTHAMTSILVESSQQNSQTPHTRITRVSERSVDTASLPGQGLSHTLVYRKPDNRPLPLLYPPVNPEEVRPPEPKAYQQLRLKERLYCLGRNLGVMVDDRATMPPWTIFQSSMSDVTRNTADIVFNPIIMSKPNDNNTVYTVLKRTKEQINALGQSVCPIVFDMGLLTKALEIVWARPEELSGVVPIEGGMHFLMSIFGGIGHVYGDAGLKDIMIESDVFAQLTAEHILSGKDFDRALRAILMVDEVLNRRFLLQFFRWAEKNSKEIPPSFELKLQELDISSEAGCNAVEEAVELIKSDLLPLLQIFRSEGRSVSPLFRFWDDYLTEVSLPVKLYLAASRHGIWDAYHYSKVKLLPFLFASNRTVYSRYMPYMVLQMNGLPENILACFNDGQFVSKLTAGSFNAVWYDYILEVTEKKALKSAGGIIGITHNEPALTRWFLSRPITAKYAMMYSASKVASSTKHHTNTPFHTQAYNESVNKMLDLFQNDNFIDPFSLTFPLSRLVNIATGVEVPKEIENSLISCHETGQKRLESFIQERFVASEEAPRKEFYDPLPRSKIKTMSETRSMTQMKQKYVQLNGEEMYLRLLAINSFKKVPLNRVLSFENAHVPLSLFTDDECMMSTKKSDFLEKLEGLAGPENIPRSIEAADCIIFDGMAVIQMLQPSSSLKLTYQQMAADFWSHILLTSSKVANVHVVFDRYEANSLKSQTRQKRGETVSSHAPVSMQPNMVIGDWKKILTSSKSKKELTRLYTRYLTENCHDLLNENVSVLVAGGLENKALKVSRDVVAVQHELDSNHEEADSRMILHLSFAGSLGVNTAIVVSPDTDVFILLVHHFSQLNVDNIFFKTGRKGIHADSTRYVPVHTVFRKLEPEEREIMLSVYCLTGCDTCSSFHGIGKKKAFQVMRKSAFQLQELSGLGTESNVSGPVKAAAISFVGLLYGQTHCASLNTLRTTMVLGKSRVKPRRLPPTNDSFFAPFIQMCIPAADLAWSYSIQYYFT